MEQSIDPHILPSFRETKESFGNYDDFTLDMYAQLEGNLALLIANAELIWPRIVCIEGCYLRISDPEFFQDKLHAGMSLSEQQSAECLYNHLHTYDLFTGDPPDTPLVAYEYVAKLLLETWAAALKLQFPNVEFRFDYATEPDAYGPTITFWHVE